MTDKAAQEFLEGQIILIDKELGWTSFDVVNKLRIELRNALGIKKIKVGHAGTLDPLATGLVILCAGKATKQIESFVGLEKEYTAEIIIGATTPSYDLETEIENTFPYQHIIQDQLKSVLDNFRGQIEQTPPNYSAKQVDGKRAYNMARQGESFQLKKNTVTIQKMEELNNFDKFNNSTEKSDIKVYKNSSRAIYQQNCATCHNLDQSNQIGPHLDNLFNRKVGGIDNFNYSRTLKTDNRKWNIQLLRSFLENPNDRFSGTNMPEVNLSANEVDSVIQFLKTKGANN